MSQFRNIKRAIGMFRMQYPFTPAANLPPVDITNLATVVELNVPQHVYEVLVQASGANVRYTLDGTDPNATSGFVLVNGNDPIAIPYIPGRTRLKFVQASAGARLHYQYGE